MTSVLPKELQNQDCYFKWIDEEFDPVVAINIIRENDCQRCVTNDYKVGECSFCKVDGEWRQDKTISSLYPDRNEEFFLKFVSWNFEMAFLNAYIGEIGKAVIRLESVKKYIGEQEEDSRGFLEGYRHVANCLQAYLHYQQGNYDSFTNDIHQLTRFHDLDSSTSCAILNLKFMFYTTLQLGYMDPKQFQDMVAVLRELVKLQPNVSKWHDLLGTRLRSYRRHHWKENIEKSYEESLAFNMAYDLSPDLPRTVANYIRDVAERLRSSTCTKEYHIINLQCGNKYFYRVCDALDFIKRETLNILRKVDELEEDQLGEDISKALSVVTEIYSSNLPNRFRNMDLAEKCIRKAHGLFPNCAKVNHRFGIFLWDKQSNFQEAVNYLTHATQLRPKNFFALCDLIQVLISQAHSNYDDLKGIFDEHLKKELTSQSLGDLYFLKACFLSATDGEETDILQCLIKAQQFGSKLKLETLQRQIWRYQWKSVSLEKFDHVLKNAKSYIQQMEMEMSEARKNYS